MSVKEIDRGWKRIKKELDKMKGSFVKVGVLSDAGVYAEEGSKGVNFADVATFNEYGTSEIPERPFMRQTFEKNKSQISIFIAKLRDRIYQGQMTTKMALKNVGEHYTGMTQEEIGSGDFKPNAPATLLANWRKHHKGVLTKGEALENDNGVGGVTKKPLIDTGRLRQSINYEVVMK